MPTHQSRARSVVNNINLIDHVESSLSSGRPWGSIVNFATSPEYCGLNLYPRQETLLKVIYLETENMTAYDLSVIEKWSNNFKDRYYTTGIQPDIWDRMEWLKGRGYTHFPHIMAVLGRRASKGMIGGILGAERIANLISLDNPQKYFGLPDGKDLYANSTATSRDQAKKFLFADIRQAVEGCKWLEPYISTSREEALSLRTPQDARRIAEMQAKGLPIEREIATIRVAPMGANSTSGRGGALFAMFYDEFAHMIMGTEGPSTSDAVYSGYQPALDQMGKDSLTYIPSSPLTKVGKFYELYKSSSILLDEYLERKGLAVTQKNRAAEEEELEEAATSAEADPEMLVAQLESWELYRDWEKGEELVGRSFHRAIQYEPKEEGANEEMRMRRMEKREPEKFKVERRAQFSEVIDAYLDPIMVDRMFDPFSLDGETNTLLEEQNNGTRKFVYHAHCDPSKSNANFALAVGHTERAKAPDEYGNYWNHVIFDKLYVWKPEDFEDHVVSYPMIMKNLKDLLSKFRTMDFFSFDQYNSIGPIQELQNHARSNQLKTRVDEVTFSAKRNKQIAEKFKTALNMGWIHAYKDTLFSDSGEEGSLLELELKFLTEKNGRIDKQSVGPVTTKDLADCYDSKTEVLTENGWKLFENVSMEERVATTNTSGELEWQMPTDRINKDYSGKMVKVKRDELDFMVTPGHRMLTRSPKRSSQNWGFGFEKAESLYGKSRVSVPISTRGDSAKGSVEVVDLSPKMPDVLHGEGRLWTKEQEAFLVENYSSMPLDHIMHACNKTSVHQIYNKAKALRLSRGQIGDRVADRPEYAPPVATEDFAKFLGFWLGDGKKVSDKNSDGFSISISQSKPEGKEYLRGLFGRMGWSWIEREGRGKEVNFVLKYAGLREYLRSLQEASSHELRLPEDSYTAWSMESRRGLVEGLVASDGNFGKFDTVHNNSKKLLDDIQMLLQTIGYASSIRQTGSKGRSVTINGKTCFAKRNTYSLRIFAKTASEVRAHHVEEVDYEGTVHCLTVPNGTLVTRRNNRTLVAGNCVMEVSVRLLEKQLAVLQEDDLASVSYGFQGGHTGAESRRNKEAQVMSGAGGRSSSQSAVEALNSFYGGGFRSGGYGMNPGRGRR